MRRSLGYLLVATVVAVGVAGLAPMLPLILAESQLADAVRTFAESPEVLQLSDQAIRSHVQTLARQRGFHLEFQEVFLQYLEPSQSDSSLTLLPRPAKLGYTLSMKLPLFGLVDRSAVSARVYPVLEGRKE